MRKIILSVLVLLLFSNSALAGNINISYTSNSTWTVPSYVTSISVLIVAGGGGGGSGYGGGGGAGGLIYNSSYTVIPGNIINITIGTGGRGATSTLAGTNGTNSVFNDSVIAIGGGSGAGGYSGNNINGGSGGGNYGGNVAGTGTVGQGNSGSGGTDGSTATMVGGGGGGANATGTASDLSIPGNGGYGYNLSINGTTVQYACGGGGASGTEYISGGYGGCSNAGDGKNGAGTNGVNGTGSGGGGGAYTGSYLAGGNGGAGIVIISYDSMITSWNNSYTNNSNLTFSKLYSSNPINFSIVCNVYKFNWTVDNVDQANNATYFSWTHPVTTGSYLVNATVNDSINNQTVSWNVTIVSYTLEALIPTNGSTSVSVPVAFTWREWPVDTPHILYVSSDEQFINTVSTTTVTTGTNENFTASVSGLSDGVQYWWKVKNNSGYYTNVMNFTAGYTPPTPGRLNITAKDEQTETVISTFNATLYNSTTVLSKLSSSGWANFSDAEVTSSEYLVRITAANYAPRNVLVDSPANLTVYLPATTNTINTIAFYLIDTTGRFPWSSSKMYIEKNSSTMVSSYFDADAKATAYLIQGDSYKVSIRYGSNTQEWGNYIPVSSGNVEIMLTEIGINSTEVKPFIYNITYDSSAATLKWNADGGSLNSLNYTIYKGSSKALVHQLITSVQYGQSTYMITNTSDVYYIYFSANTTQGIRNQTFAFDLRGGSTISGEGKIRDTMGLGSFTVPDWVLTVLAIIALVMLAAGFGAIYAELGAVITLVMTLALMNWNILRGIGAGIGFFAGMTVVTVMYYMRARDTGQVAMMAYKAAMFLIFFNFAIIIINGSGIIPGAVVDIYGNDCQGSNAATPGCILARISTLAPQETQNNAAGMLQQITFVLITATAFGLIILTLQFMLGLFWFGIGVSEIYLSQLPIGWEWKLPLQAGILIIYVTGFMQYKAATSLRDKE